MADAAHEPDPVALLESGAQRAVADEDETALPVSLEGTGQAQHVLALAEAAEAEEERAVGLDAELRPGFVRSPAV